MRHESTMFARGMLARLIPADRKKESRSNVEGAWACQLGETMSKFRNSPPPRPDFQRTLCFSGLASCFCSGSARSCSVTPSKSPCCLVDFPLTRSTPKRCLLSTRLLGCNGEVLFADAPARLHLPGSEARRTSRRRSARRS